MEHQSLSRTLQELESGRYSAEELTRHYLDRIKRHDPALNSFVTLLEEPALAEARAADKARANGNHPPLAGIPIAHKDIFCTEGTRTSAGSRMLDSFIAPYSATAVERLQAAGTVMLGKTNMDEFAMGSSNENSWYGPVKNPFDQQRVPGGSSGGSAAAVAAGLCLAATGTDTGGSIRQPAAMCGITGLKPTYGRVSRWGMIAYASSLDQGGPMGRSAEDVALMLNHMAGFDARDSTSIDAPAEDFTRELQQPLGGMTLGVCREQFESLPGNIGSVLDAALSEYEKLGATLVDVSLPNSRHAIPAYYIIAPAEASANLARYDGVRYGHRCEHPADLADLYKRTRAEGFGAEVKRRILVGTFALSAGYYDAYYRKAQQVRRLVRDDFDAAFKQCDLMLAPTAPTPAFKLGEMNDDPVTMYQQDVFTITANLAGVPAASIPAGFVDDLPIGLQLIGNHLAEARILNAAHQFQQQTDFHQARPGGFA